MSKSKGLKAAQSINSEIALKAQIDAENRIRKELEAKRNNTIENKRTLRRNKINQFLSQCNKNYPEQRIKNTEAFVELLCFMISKEWNEVARDSLLVRRVATKKVNINEIDIDKFVRNYSPHINNLIKFDEEMVYCDDPKCKKSMVKLFAETIQVQQPILFSKFANLILEKEAKNQKTATIKEA